MSEKRLIPKKVAAIHDLSCFGRCALTVVIPTLSALGAQVIPMPTALLSTHTGGFTDLYFRDLSEDMDEIAAHFDMSAHAVSVRLSRVREALRKFLIKRGLEA